MATEFKPAPEEVLAVLNAVIDRHARFADIRNHELRIEVLMAWADNGCPIKKHGAVAAACIKVVNGEERAKGGPDVRIKVDAVRYGALGPKSREALFAHELYHLEFQYGDEGLKRDVYRRPVVKCIPDDWCINGFQKVVEWYGDDAVELRSYRAVGEVLAQNGLFDRPAERLADHLGPDVTVSVNGRQVETVGQLGEAIFPDAGGDGQTCAEPESSQSEESTPVESSQVDPGDGEHPLPPHLAEPKGPSLDRDVWILLSSPETHWVHDTFFVNPVLKLPDNADEDLLKRADSVIGRIGGEWDEGVKGYTFTLVRCQDALKAMLAARRAPTVWQDARLSDVVPPSLARRLAEVCGIHTAGQLDAQVKTLHDQDTLADAAGVPRVDMADAIVLLEEWIQHDGRPAPKADRAEIAAAPVQDGSPPLWHDLAVTSLRVPGPVHGKLLDAQVKTLGDLHELLHHSAYTDAALAKRLGLTQLDLTDVRRAFRDITDGPCQVCGGDPKLICPACGRTRPAEEEGAERPAKKTRTKKADVA